MDKAGLEAQFVARGYKSAANLFTEAHYTDAHREADNRLIESLHNQVWQGIAEARTVDVGCSTASPTGHLLRDDAVEAGLVDRIGFRDEAYRRIAELTGAEDLADADDDDARPAVPVPLQPDPPPQNRVAGPQTVPHHRRRHGGRSDRQRPGRSAGHAVVAVKRRRRRHRRRIA